ncbi:hypothetical protein [Pseudomonas sp. lyk4-TYG-107]|jgi:hypothetical protein|uniref:hypothetical protein n=1 Tax=Pseudomonas sp. lyk4-TYG-107 TaxID=3040317 RepID=UPI00255514DA|nr:hypothetical protein [Pseudomonas sp. lyk4-TYG-107]
MSSKYKLMSLNLANLHAGDGWNLLATILLPAGTTTNFSPKSPANADSMSVAELKAYALREFEKAND